MRMSQLVGRTLRESPKDAELPSHRYLIRGGFARQYTAGVYGLLPLGLRSISKIEAIVREEMNAVDGQEIFMPCLSTSDLWDSSGRYNSIGKEMFRLSDRNEKKLVLNMTHEEPVVFLAKTELTSYRQLPAMMYQIQTKFRDEPRPRGGLIRLREFTMKDGYSFHASEEDLKQYYDRVHESYNRIFRRAGFKNFVSVQSDNGMFGGKFSHEFQLLVPTGEDKLLTCGSCGYRANLEVATTRHVPWPTSSSSLKKIPTPGMKTIEQLCDSLGITPNRTIKAVMFQTRDELPVIAFVRGDLEVLEPKLKVLLSTQLDPAKDEIIRKSGAEPGCTGPKGLNLAACKVVLDTSVIGAQDALTGANEADAHYQGFDLDRDFLSTLTPEQKKAVITGDISAARPGDSCPHCDSKLIESRGIEIGNIFHLGTKYSQSMGCTYLAEDGKAYPHIMGCYGIGITRMLPALIEENHDDRGIIFPISVAPFEVHLCVLNRREVAVFEASEKLYSELKKAGIDVLIDDRDEKAGSQFADADLIGIPIRLTISPKTLAVESVEWKFRNNREPQKMVKLENLVEEVVNAVRAEYQS